MPAITDAIKIVMFFRLGGDGWSETYYISGSSITDLQAQVLSVANPELSAGTTGGLILVRQALLFGSASIIHVRLSIDGQFRQEEALTFPQTRFPGKFPALVGGDPVSAVDTQLSLLCRFSGVDSENQIHHRNLYLGGLPSTVLQGDSYISAAPWSGLFTKFSGLLTKPPFLEKCQTDVNSVVTPTQAITYFAVGADGRTVQIQPNVLGALATHGRIILRGVDQPRGWNGLHNALVSGPPAGGVGDSMVVGPTRKAGVSVPAFLPNPKATVQASVPEYFPITLIQDEDVVERKRGRFFGQPRGRRST